MRVWKHRTLRGDALVDVAHSVCHVANDDDDDDVRGALQWIWSAAASFVRHGTRVVSRAYGIVATL